jgi:hypothetical protein
MLRKRHKPEVIFAKSLLVDLLTLNRKSVAAGAKTNDKLTFEVAHSVGANQTFFHAEISQHPRHFRPSAKYRPLS